MRSAVPVGRREDAPAGEERTAVIHVVVSSFAQAFSETRCNAPKRRVQCTDGIGGRVGDEGRRTL